MIHTWKHLPGMGAHIHMPCQVLGNLAGRLPVKALGHSKTAMPRPSAPCLEAAISPGKLVRVTGCPQPCLLLCLKIMENHFVLTVLVNKRGAGRANMSPVACLWPQGDCALGVLAVHASKRPSQPLACPSPPPTPCATCSFLPPFPSLSPSIFVLSSFSLPSDPPSPPAATKKSTVSHPSIPTPRLSPRDTDVQTCLLTCQSFLPSLPSPLSPPFPCPPLLSPAFPSPSPAPLLSSLFFTLSFLPYSVSLLLFPLYSLSLLPILSLFPSFSFPLSVLTPHFTLPSPS